MYEAIKKLSLLEAVKANRAVRRRGSHIFYIICSQMAARLSAFGWIPKRRQWKMTTDNSRTQISEPRPNNVQKGTAQKTSVTEIFRRLGVHSDGERSQERTGEDNQLSDTLRGR
jgi:hypothetical protein